MKPAYYITGVAAALVIATSGALYAQQGQGGGMARGQGPMFDFEELDANGDGAITAEEMTARAESRFNAADANGDGKLTSDEMADQMRAMMADRMTARAQAMIESRDSDGDGMLSADEMRAGGMDRMFARLDSDGDGKVSAEEFDAIGDRRGGRMGKSDKGWGHARHGAMDCGGCSQGDMPCGKSGAKSKSQN
ncbi:Ca2+-binding EF-hand superfamily protein [Roseovarius halotolerans]|jgi:Ca2+-binding EF-hand superfamily protein|uniref:Transaldolase/EF-hand domain-containing protein n=1 Tax=Roseovarius halotolerans TaxID=505353 RepID=A0A1X6Y8E9_9RHOB|nr:EF-hand domain-containing protein [Roseovarius halotolerans]RKT35133.1 Ca2+-binding EF-hand superfamily protein [Roseovarius halotolerans]SLN13389.1 transaldolase/EF-hand domain-containing protein [Roseovarius halotolerans]